jgi:hypothetical protein
MRASGRAGVSCVAQVSQHSAARDPAVLGWLCATHAARRVEDRAAATASAARSRLPALNQKNQNRSAVWLTPQDEYRVRRDTATPVEPIRPLSSDAASLARRGCAPDRDDRVVGVARGGIRFPIETASLPADARSKLLVQKQNIRIFVGGGGTDGRGVATLI